MLMFQPLSISFIIVVVIWGLSTHGPSFWYWFLSIGIVCHHVFSVPSIIAFMFFLAVVHFIQICHTHVSILLETCNKNEAWERWTNTPNRDKLQRYALHPFTRVNILNIKCFRPHRRAWEMFPLIGKSQIKTNDGLTFCHFSHFRQWQKNCRVTCCLFVYTVFRLNS